ncbi:MAG TPA: hypothetical protein VMT27_07595, partial [Actinomycetes bacterium]|nr:hypothetical protein [Actinomycetes bacterium]
MASRSMRWTVRVSVVALAVGVAAPAAWAATTWKPGPNAASPTGAIGKNWAWNYGSALGKLNNGKVSSGYISDATTPERMYVVNGNVDTGAGTVAWGSSQAISPGTINVDRPSLATGITNNNIYATFVTQKHYTLDPTEPRQLRFRAFTGGAWQPSVNLSSATGRVDYPVVSGSANQVYVAWTNSNTGQVALRASTNAGVSWSAVKTAGTTTRIDPDETAAGTLAAWPGVCSSGSVVAVPFL